MAKIHLKVKPNTNMLKPIVLKNGLTIIRLPKPGSKIFIAGFVVRTGVASEEGYFKEGISSFIERLFWCGTDKHNSTRSLNLTLENLGGSFNSSTDFETTEYYISVPDYNQYKAVSMLSEIIQRSYFDEQDIEKQKKHILENLKPYNEQNIINPDVLAMENLYEGTSYGSPINGSIDSINGITQADILEYLSHQYRPDQSFLVLAGNFENKKIMELAEHEWSIWNPRPKKFIEPMDITEEDIGELPRISYRQKGIALTSLVIGFILDYGMRPPEIIEAENRLNESENEDQELDLNYEKITSDYLKNWARLEVLNTILGKGLSSRLWSKAVEEELLFNQAESDLIRLRKTAYLQISGFIENQQFSFGLESVLSILEALKKTTVSINEITKAKEYLKGTLVMQHEDLLFDTSWQLNQFIHSGLQLDVKDFVQAIDNVSTAEIRTLAADLFVPERMVISTLGTAKETRLVDKLIKKYLT